MNSNDIPADPADSTIDPCADVKLPATDDAPAGLTSDDEMALALLALARKEVALAMRRRARDGELALMRERYKVGQLVLTAFELPEAYGPMSDDQLIALFGGEETLLRDACRLAARHTPEDFEAMLAARDPETGFQLNYDHLVALLKVEDDALANQFFALTLAECWSPTQLARAINKKLRKRAKRPKAPRAKPVRLRRQRGG